jgi:hypothetical protein
MSAVGFGYGNKTQLNGDGPGQGGTEHAKEEGGDKDEHNAGHKAILATQAETENFASLPGNPGEILIDGKRKRGIAQIMGNNYLPGSGELPGR